MSGYPSPIGQFGPRMSDISAYPLLSSLYSAAPYGNVSGAMIDPYWNITNRLSDE
jgi:hypothetical protein